MPTTLLPETPVEDALRFAPGIKAGSVDRSAKNGVLRGFVVAQLGHFKSEGRGQFTDESLEQIVKIGNAEPGGMKSRFTHPSLSSDGLGSFLGRATDFFLDKTSTGVPAVRADLHFAKSANLSPRGKLAEYVMRLAEEDPDALSSSLVVSAKEERILKDESGQRIDDEPPIWIPKSLRAIDIVDVGDAVDGLLSSDEQNTLHDAGVRNASKMLDMLFAGQEKETIRSRCSGFLESYITNRFGEDADELELEDSDMSDNHSQETDKRLSALETGMAEVVKAQAEGTQALTTLTELLTKREEQREVEAAKTSRLKAIQAKGSLAHASAEQVTKWCNDEALSVEDVKDIIIEGKFDKAKKDDLGSDDAGDVPGKETAEQLGKKMFALRGKKDGPKVINPDLTAEDYALSARIDAGEVGVLDLIASKE